MNTSQENMEDNMLPEDSMIPDETVEHVPDEEQPVVVDKSGWVSDRGFWLIDDVSTPEHAFDRKLCRAMYRFLRQQKCETMLDLGCGLGPYSDFMSARGIGCTGYDGNPHTEELTNGKYKVLDLSVDVDLGEQFDWVLSLEVGEHIPAEFESEFIGNVVRHARHGVILSWAVEGQGGLGHVNCRNNDYIKDVMLSHGFESVDRTEKFFRKNVDLYWFENTVMVFRRIK